MVILFEIKPKKKKDKINGRQSGLRLINFRHNGKENSLVSNYLTDIIELISHCKMYGQSRLIHAHLPTQMFVENIDTNYSLVFKSHENGEKNIVFLPTRNDIDLLRAGLAKRKKLIYVVFVTLLSR